MKKIYIGLLMTVVSVGAYGANSSSSSAAAAASAGAQAASAAGAAATTGASTNEKSAAAAVASKVTSADDKSAAAKAAKASGDKNGKKQISQKEAWENFCRENRAQPYIAAVISPDGKIIGSKILSDGGAGKKARGDFKGWAGKNVKPAQASLGTALAVRVLNTGDSEGNFCEVVGATTSNDLKAFFEGQLL